MSDFVTVFVSEWGDFTVPADISDKTRWVKNDIGGIVGVEPDAQNRHFLNWLHEMEVKAGKPE